MSTKNTAAGTGGTTWKRFLTPGWFFGLLFVVIFSYFCFSFFAPWQLGKDRQIVQRNEQIRAAFDADPSPVEDILPVENGDQWKRVILKGRFLPDQEVLLRLRPAAGSPAYHSLTPFQLESGETILVNRGFLPANKGNAVPDIPPAPTGDISTIGMVQLSEAPSDRPAIEEQGFTQVYSINPEQIGDLTGTELLDGYVQLTENQPGVLTPIPVPMLERGSHLSYGLQWLAFGILAPIALLYFVYNELRERKRVRREQEELQAGSAPHPVHTRPRRPQNARERYGNSRPDHFGPKKRRRR